VTFLRFLIAWANVPFAVAGGIAIIFALLQVSGLLGVLTGGGDHDADGDGEIDADGDADGDADHDAEHGGDHAGIGEAIFGGLGVGRLPLSILWQSYAVVFAVTGLALNARFLGSTPPLVTLAWTVPSGLVVGYGVVAVLARVLGPVFATKPHEATSRAELVGLAGTVISSKVSREFGEIRIRDKSGHDVRVICRLAEGASVVPEGGRVVVVDYEAEGAGLLVAPLEDDESQAASAKG
jgi:hypothetical protein